MNIRASSSIVLIRNTGRRALKLFESARNPRDAKYIEKLDNFSFGILNFVMYDVGSLLSYWMFSVGGRIARNKQIRHTAPESISSADLALNIRQL